MSAETKSNARLTYQAATAERQQEGDPTDDRGQDHRQGGERAEDVLTAKPRPRLDPREGNAEDDRNGGRAQRADEREPKRVQ